MILFRGNLKGCLMKKKFNGSCLKQTTHYHHKNFVSFYIVYELGASGSNNSDPTLKIVYLVQLL